VIKHRSKKARPGFTLVELLVASTINLLVLAGLFSLLLMYAQTTRGVMLQASLDSEGRRAVRQLQIDVRRSIKVGVPHRNRLNITYANGDRAYYRFTANGRLLYDSDGGGPNPRETIMSGLAMGAERGNATTFSVTKIAGRPTQVHFNFALVDPYDRDGLQVFTIATTISGRVPPSDP